MPNSFDLTTLSHLFGLKLRSRHLVEGLLAGEHRGAGQGLAVEFAQLRPYVPGDELRRIDWKVFARTDKFHVKQYEEDVDLCVYLLLDASAGMSYRGTNSPLSKFEYAQLLLAINAYLTLRQNDSVCWGISADSLLTGQPVRGLAQWQTLLEVIESTEKQYNLPACTIPISESIPQLLSQWRRKGLIIIFSDWFDSPPSIAGALKQIRAAGHDCRIYQVLDSDELLFPFTERTRFSPYSTSKNDPALELEPVQLQSAYIRLINQHVEFMRFCCDNLEIDYRLTITNKPLEEAFRGEGGSR